MNAFININGTEIPQLENGLYSITAVFKASGALKKNHPSYWMETKQAQELRQLINKRNTGIPVYDSIQSIRGHNGGVFAAKQLVYNYSMWVSAEFNLTVIEAFDEFVTAATQQELTDAKHRVDNAMQRDMFEKWQSPRDPACLQVIMKCSPFQAKQYHDELVGKGILGYKDVQQPPRRQYFARKSHPAIIGRNGETVLFDESIKELLPTQTDFVEFSGFEGVAI